MQPISIHAETLRGGHLESLSRVRAIALPVGAGPNTPPLFESGDGQAPAFWRSAAKFIQALSLFHSGAMDRFGFSRDELALACASHSGGDAHVAVAAGMLAKIGLSTDALHCGPHIPLGSEEAKLLAERGAAPTRLHNNCSGKHSGMLAVCLARGWPIADYKPAAPPTARNPAPPVAGHRGAAFADRYRRRWLWAVVFRSPLRSLALGYLRLVHGACPSRTARRVSRSCPPCARRRAWWRAAVGCALPCRSHRRTAGGQGWGRRSLRAGGPGPGQLGAEN